MKRVDWLLGGALARMKITLLLFGALSLCILVMTPAQGRESSPVVKANRVYKLWVELHAPEGKWQSDPRQDAILEAHRKALRVLTAHYRQSEEASSKLPSDDTLLDMVQSFSVRREKVNSMRYRGMFHLTFKQKALEKWMKQSIPGEQGAETETKIASNGVRPEEATMLLVLQVKLDSFSDWVQFKSALEMFESQLARQEVLSLSQTQARLSLAWRGKLGLFADRLETLGFKVTKYPDHWDIEHVPTASGEKVPVPGGAIS